MYMSDGIRFLVEFLGVLGFLGLLGLLGSRFSSCAMGFVFLLAQ